MKGSGSLFSNWQKFWKSNREYFEKYKLGFVWDILTLMIGFIGAGFFITVFTYGIFFFLNQFGIQNPKLWIGLIILIITAIVIIAVIAKRVKK